MRSTEAKGTAATSPLESPPEVIVGPNRLRASVVICAYSEREHGIETSAAVKSALSQPPAARGGLLLVVATTTPSWPRRARTELADVTVLENGGSAGIVGRSQYRDFARRPSPSPRFA